MVDPSPLTPRQARNGQDFASAPLSCFAGRPPQQIGLLVRDIDTSLRTYVGLMGIGPWACYTYDPTNLRELSYRGAPGRFSMKIALSAVGPEVELIQPVDGPSIYHDWMADHGEGVHHLAYRVPSIDDGISEMEARGYPVIQYGAGFGLDGDGAFAYFDTVKDLGTIIELRLFPRRRRPPERTVEAWGRG